MRSDLIGETKNHMISAARFKSFWPFRISLNQTDFPRESTLGRIKFHEFLLSVVYFSEWPIQGVSSLPV